ncbi:hypothetical protein BDD12DRAFT_943890 [Trichophaea hybrida]|nr:hypothetical protein BDD12DRAFT_943890 [Trichophaea hybrida]
MDTPRSESPSYATSPPATDLDDHRFQPHSLPRSNTVTSQLRPDMSELANEAGRPRSRASEHAVYDNSELLSPAYRGIDYAPDAILGRQGSTRSVRDYCPSISVQFPSPMSSRSPSPPNSVDAFADPEHRRMRERAGTATSQLPSELGLSLHRTNSRRQTFCEGDDRIRDSSDDVAQVEEDVCFPPPDEPRVRGAIIDFEEMDDFVVMQNRVRSEQRQRKTSTVESFKGGYRPDMGPKAKAEEDECTIDDSTSDMNEKGDESTPPPVRRVSKPDRFSFFSSEMDTTVHASEIGDLLFDGENFHDLFRGGQSVWWLDCLNPSPEEFSMLMKAFAIHPLTAEDIRVQETREKVELFKNYYFVCFRSFVQQKTSEDYMEPINIYIIVFREGVLSFHFASSSHSANVRRRIRQLRDYVALSADWICYALIDDIVDSFAPVITDIERDSDAIEDVVFIVRDDDGSALLKRIGDCRKRTMVGMRLLGGKADVIKGFAKRCNEQYQITPRGRLGCIWAIFKTTSSL